jgi:hypothetical protein
MHGKRPEALSIPMPEGNPGRHHVLWHFAFETLRPELTAKSLLSVVRVFSK